MLAITAAGVGPLARLSVGCCGSAASLATLKGGRNWELLGRTAGLALSVAAGATCLGTFLGYRLGATAWRGKALFRIMLLVPLAIPPYLHAVGWTTLLGPEGTATASLATLLRVVPTAITAALYSFGGAVFVLTLAYFPVAAFFAEKALAWSSPALVDAARVFGANSWQVFWAARWPQLRTGVASAAMIIFLLAASDLGVPTLLKVPVFNTEVFTQLSAFNDVATASALTVPLILIGLLLVRVERRVTLGEFRSDGTDVQPPRPAFPGQGRVNVALFVLLMAFAVGLPVGAIVQAADPEAARRMAALSWAPMLNSFRYAGIAAALIVVLSTILAGLLRGAPHRLCTVTDAVIITTFAVPSTIVALALLTVFGRQPWASWLDASTLVVAALVLRYLIVGYRIVGGAMEQIPADLLEAAGLDGAGALRRMWHIVIPQLRLALLAALGATFILGLAEIGSTILLYPPGGETLLIAMLSIEANSPRAYVAALMLLELLPLIGILVLSLSRIGLGERVSRVVVKRPVGPGAPNWLIGAGLTVLAAYAG
jgi:iron(III) transport system permease protein